MNKIAQNQQSANIVLITSLCFSIYWIGIYLIKDVYAWSFVGAVYEILWLPGLIVIYILPVLILLLAFINRFQINFKYYISLSILVLTIILLFTVFN